MQKFIQIGKLTIKFLKINRRNTEPSIDVFKAKFLEFAATKKQPTDVFEITILSEKHICESCEGVVKQFKEMYPNATVNIVSGKRGYNGDEKGLKTWKNRK